MDATVVFGALLTLGGGVITYLLRDNVRLRRREAQLMNIIYQNSEAMKAFVKMRGLDPSIEGDSESTWDG